MGTRVGYIGAIGEVGIEGWWIASFIVTQVYRVTVWVVVRKFDRSAILSIRGHVEESAESGLVACVNAGKEDGLDQKVPVTQGARKIGLRTDPILISLIAFDTPRVLARALTRMIEKSLEGKVP